MKAENYEKLFTLLLKSAKQISMGVYDDSDKLIELTKEGKYPQMVSELAEAFSMMMVRVESREYRLEQLIEELEEKNKKLKEMLLIIKESERLARDMEIAAKIQKSMLPETPPQIEGVELAGRCVPAKNVGGDYFDYFKMKNKKLGVCIADVSGHNVGSALVMAITRQALRFESKHSESVSEILAETNIAVFDDLSNAGLFITAFCVGYDTTSRELTWANGGHNMPILWRAETKEIECLDADGMILGLLDDVAFEERRTTLAPGDILLLYTDGITEGKNASGKMYGEERLFDLVRENALLSAQELIDLIYTTAEHWGTGVEQYDDVTATILKVVS